MVVKKNDLVIPRTDFTSVFFFFNSDVQLKKYTSEVDVTSEN